MANDDSVKDKIRRSMAPKGGRPATAAEQIKSSGSQFSMILSSEDTAVFDRLMMVVRQKTKKPVKKAEIMRILLALAADDPTLTNQVVEEFTAQQ